MVSIHQNVFTLYKIFFLLLYYYDGFPAATVACFFIIFEE